MSAPDPRLAALRGSVVAITGASGGIGEAAVRRLLELGATVRGLTRSDAGAERLQAPPDLHPQIGRLSRKLRDQEQPRGSLCVCHSCIVTSLQV